MKAAKAWWVIIVLAAIFLLRVLLFVSQYGAIEHDSGWYLGVAKNLAHRGIYASYTNTIVEEGAGPHAPIHSPAIFGTGR